MKNAKPQGQHRTFAAAWAAAQGRNADPEAWSKSQPESWGSADVPKAVPASLERARNFARLMVWPIDRREAAAGAKAEQLEWGAFRKSTAEARDLAADWFQLCRKLGAKHARSLGGPGAVAIGNAHEGMAGAFDSILAILELVEHRLDALVTRGGLTSRTGGHFGGKGGHKAKERKAAQAARLERYKATLRAAYAEDPNMQWKTATALVVEAEATPAEAGQSVIQRGKVTRDAVRKFLARHGVKAADFKP